MNIKWTLAGAGWEESLSLDENIAPMEAGTKIIEKIFESDKNYSFGAIFCLTHENMKSDKEHLYVYAPHLLANAGQFDLATELDKIITNSRFDNNV